MLQQQFYKCRLHFSHHCLIEVIKKSVIVSDGATT
ncbi:DUF3709 domain-containing protein [Staphylococcus simiae]